MLSSSYFFYSFSKIVAPSLIYENIYLQEDIFPFLLLKAPYFWREYLVFVI